MEGRSRVSRTLATLAAASLSASAFVALSAVLAVPVSATASSYQVFVAGTDSSNGEAAVKVITMPAGTPDTIDLGSGTGVAYGVAVNGSGTQAFATVGYDCDESCDSYEVVPIAGPFTFTSEGAFNGTVGSPILTDATTGGIEGSNFELDSGIVTSGDVVAVANEAYPNSGVYLFNDTYPSSEQGSAALPDYADLPFNPQAITANAAGLVAVAAEGEYFSDGPSDVTCGTSGAGEVGPGCVWTFNVSPLTNNPTVTTAVLDIAGSHVDCNPSPDTGEDNNCYTVQVGLQGIVISPENGDIYVTDNSNKGVWQINPSYTTADVVGFQYLADAEYLEAITINGAGNTLYLSNGTDPFALEVALSDDTVASDADTTSTNLTGSDTGGTWQIGIGLSPDGSEALVLDGDNGESSGGTSYVDEIATDAFTAATFGQYDPPVGATAIYVAAATIPVPTTGTSLPLALAVALFAAGVMTLGGALVRRRRLV
ncbi:MAG: hypothetical protein WBA31_08155 [Candidatus Dormiibacterota bacterium]